MNTEQTLLELREQAGNFTRTDGFPSRTLRHAIIATVNTIPLDQEDKSKKFPPHQNERARRDYLREAAATGERLTMEYAMERLSPALDDFLQALVEHGAANLGHKIGLEYGYSIYPVAQFRRDNRLPVPNLDPEIDTETVFGFTVITVDNQPTISDVRPLLGPTGSRIDESDDESIAICETFAFAGRHRAEAAREEWFNFTDGKRAVAPVAYAIRLTLPPVDAGLEPSVGWVEHTAEGTASGEYTTPDGVTVANLVYGTLDAALAARSKLIQQYYAEDDYITVPRLNFDSPRREPVPTPIAPEPVAGIPATAGKDINH